MSALVPAGYQLPSETGDGGLAILQISPEIISLPRERSDWSERVWRLARRRLLECADCRHQTSVTSGTVLQGTRKPLKTWFRAVLEMTVRRNGVSAKDLQRIMGFGSYETAWTWLHKIRRGLVRDERGPLGDVIQLDESFTGKSLLQSMIFVGAEVGGRIRMAHAPNNDETTMKQFVDREIAKSAEITTDGLATYNERVLGARKHEMVVQTPE
jgi:hypothetical protein